MHELTDPVSQWYIWTTLALSVLLLLIAVGLLVFSRRTIPTVLLGLFLIMWSVLASIGIVLVMLLDMPVNTAGAIYLAAYVLQHVALLMFAVVYPNLALSRTRRWSLGLLVAAGSAFVLSIIVASWRGAPLDPLWDLHWITTYATFLAGLTLLGARWLRGPSEPYRIQVLWGLLVFFFWGMHDGGSAWLVYPLLEGSEWFANWSSSPARMIQGVLSALTAIVAIGLAATAVIRALTGRARASDRAFALLSPFLLALTTVQVFERGAHVPLDFTAAALVIYGVARFNVVDLDIRLKSGLARGFVAGAVIAAFFVASELAALLVENVVGSAAVGVLAAGALVLFISPLHRSAEALAQKAMPRVQDDEAYRTYRRFQIYRVALAGALQDGHMNPSEARSLANLRDHLGLTPADHAALETELRSGSGSD